MVARPGRLQSAFTAGEIDPQLYERTEIKYFNTGARHMENVVVIPQGGFRLRDGLRDVGQVNGDAARLFTFDASDGASYDLVFSPSLIEAWGQTSQLATVSAPFTANQMPGLTVAQLLDTMLIFHRNLRPRRLKHLAADDWQLDNAPFANLPNYDYGEAYTNGVPAKWQIEFIGLGENTAFTLTVSQQETVSMVYGDDTSALASAMQAAILALPNVAAGVTVTHVSGKKFDIQFSGAGNEGDGWAVSGRVVNKADAAILARKTVVGVKPGEPVISSARGWPSCGCFYSQRLLTGGFRSLPNAWLMSLQTDPYNFDERFTGANGPALIPMDVPGGERIERIVAGRNLLIFTTKAEYWLAERALSKTTAPNHVQSSTNGIRPGTPVIDIEGAQVYLHSDGNVLGEFRYTDVEGNFVSTDLSLLAPHLVRQGRDLARRRADGQVSGNLVALIEDDGDARLATILREQEVTAFARMSSDGTPIAVATNGRNEMSWIFQRGSQRRLERFEPGLLLDEAVSFTYGSPTDTITGLGRFNGREIWIIGDLDVFGPFTVSDGTVTLPVVVSNATAGTWKPPRVQTLPLPRTVGPGIVLKRKARIHSVKVSVLDTTSIAIGVNGKPPHSIDLMRYGMDADLPELQAAYTGDITLRGLRGWEDDPYVEITQLRPGRLTVRSVTIEAAL